MAKGFLSRNMDFVLAVWDPWDLGREGCEEARIPCGGCTDMVGKRVGSRQMLRWETERATESGRRGGEGRAERKRVGRSGRGKKRQSSGDLHHDRKGEERNQYSVCGRTESWVTI